MTAGAASVAGAIGASAGVAVSIGLGIAINSVSGAVAAYIDNVTDGLTTTIGAVNVSASENGLQVTDASTGHQLDLSNYGISGPELDSVAALDTAHQQTTGAGTLSAIEAAFATAGASLPTGISVSPVDGSAPGVTRTIQAPSGRS